MLKLQRVMRLLLLLLNIMVLTRLLIKIFLIRVRGLSRKYYQGKSIVLLATSSRYGGAVSVLTAAVNSAPFFGGELRGHLSVPSFHQNFDVEQGCIKKPEIQAQLAIVVKSLQN